MNHFVKKLLQTVLSPAIRAFEPLAEMIRRVHAFVLLAAKLSTKVDPSVVILGPPEVHGTGRVTLGRNLLLYPGLYLETKGSGYIEIGDNVVISRGTHLVARSGITIGAGTMIGEYCSIRDGNHRRDKDGGIHATSHDSSPITIGKSVWIGRGVMILPGISIGDGATVGANAVVTRDVPAGVLVAGVPAKILSSASSRMPVEAAQSK